MKYIFTILIILTIILPATAQNRFKAITDSAWKVVQSGISNPTEVYKSSSQISKTGREYIHYANILIKVAAQSENPLRNQLYDEAKDHLLQAINLDSTLRNAFLLAGNVYYKRDSDIDAATKYYERALQLDAHYYDAHYNLAVIKSENKNFAEAIALAKQANEDDTTGEYQSRTLGFISNCYRDSGEYDSEVVYLKLALNYDPYSAQLNYDLGLAYGKFKNDLAAAIPYLEKAAFSDDNKPLYIEDLTVAYGMSEMYKQDYDLLKMALKKFPAYKPFYINMAITCDHLGKKNEAERYRKKADELP